MKNKYISFIKIATVLTLTILMTSCWDSRELDSLAFVLGVGIDVADEEDNIDLTVQTAKISKSSSAGSEGISNEKFINMNTSGKTLFYTLREVNHQYSRKPFFQHNYVIVLGEELAKKGVSPYLDLFMRDHETRMSAWILVAKGRARDILDIEPQLESIPSVKIDKLIANQKSTSQSMGVDLMHFVQALENKSKTPLATILEVIEEDDNQIITITGLAVFKDDKLIGELNKTESRGLLWVLNEIVSGILEVETENGTADVEIKQAKSKTKVKVDEDNKISVEIEISHNGNIGIMSGYEGMELKEIADEIENASNQKIKNEIEQSIEKAKELKSDIFGFGNEIRRKDYKKWKSMKQNWEDIFPTIEISINVKTEIMSAGQIETLDKFKE